MYVRRTAQLQLLEEQYAAQGNNLVILYGRKGMGKTTLIREFLKDKQWTYYYEGTECVRSLQLDCMNRQWNSELEAEPIQDYSLLFSEIIGMNEKKTVIVLDEFHYILKSSPDFADAFQLLHNPNRPVMFVLCSSSIRWVENEMVQDLGGYASYITAFIKLKEFSFVDFVNRFPDSSVETCIHINAILGGIPEYLNEWQETKSLRENITDILLDKDGRLIMASQQFLKLELREPAVYNTILFLLAQGNRKLNALHEKTGFSRAKISVYLKNLIQLDLVEKLVPLNEEGKENVQKGLYRIKDHFFNFWYRFVYPNLSDLMLGKTRKVYKEKVAPYLDDYMQEYFADVCTEYLKLSGMQHRLPENFLWWDRWYGKNGTIDILAQGESGKTLVGKCLWESQKAELSDYESLLALTFQAGKTPDYCYIFSRSGFTEELQEQAQTHKDVFLVGLDEF